MIKFLENINLMFQLSLTS